MHVAHGAMRVVGIGDCPRGMLCLCMERLEETFVGGDGGKKKSALELWWWRWPALE